MSKNIRAGLIILLAVILAFSMAVTGCEKKVAKPKPKPTVKVEKGGNLNYMLGEPVSIDTLDLEESEGTEVGANLFDSLVQVNPTTEEVEPAVAESWKSNKDASVWTFKLRKGTKFHNGREVVAKDFKYAFERIAMKDSGSQVAYHLAPVKGFDEMQAGTATEMSGIKVKDKYTLEITLQYAFAEFPYVMAHPTLAPVPKEEVDKDPKAFADNPIGNGPFMMDGPWKHNQEIKVVPFKDYYGQKPNLDSVTFKIFDSEETAFLEFKAGNIDFTLIPTGQMQAVKTEYGEGKYEAKPGEDALFGPELAIYYYGFNMDSPLFKDKPELRQAISLAINRDAICQTVYEGTREPASGVVVPGIPGFQKNASKYTKYDATKAKELLKKAGYPDGKGPDGQPLKIQISINTGRGHEGPAQIIQQNLKDIGIDATINGMEWGAYLDAGAKGQLDFFRLGWIADYPIMDNFLYPLFYSKIIPTEANGWTGDNRSRFNDPEFDKLVDKARKELDKDKRIELYRKAEKIILDNAVICPLVVYKHHHVAAKKVRGLVYNNQGVADLNTAWISTK